MSYRYNTLSLVTRNNKSQVINKTHKAAILDFLYQIVDLSIIAHETFINGDLNAFDAQVGENLCQIRAYKIITLKTNTNKSLFFDELTNVKKYKKKIANTFVFNEIIDKNEVIESFFYKAGLLVELSENFMFILISFFLARFSIKKENIPVIIDLDGISKSFNISRNKAKRLTHNYQMLLSEMGCRFIIELSAQIFPELNYRAILMKTYKISDENRHVLPCFLVTEVVFYHAIKNKIPIVFIVKRQSSQASEEIVYFSFLQDRNTLKVHLICPEDYIHQYGLVVYGLSCAEGTEIEDKNSYIKKVLAADPMTLLFANAASHIQFSGKTLEKFKTNPYQDIDMSYCRTEQHHKHTLDYMRKYAVSAGCSEVNQKLFFVRHIYADQISGIINKMRINYDEKAYCAYQIYNEEEINDAIS